MRSKGKVQKPIKTIVFLLFLNNKLYINLNQQRSYNYDYKYLLVYHSVL